MSGYTPDERLRVEQIAKLRRQWLKDQELSPREPVVKPTSRGAVNKFWNTFLEPKSLWRLYTYKAYRGGLFALGCVLTPAWIVHYCLKYHVASKPYGVVEAKPKLFPYENFRNVVDFINGDIIVETGEVVPDIPTTHSHH